MTAPSHDHLDTLASAMRGRLVRPGDAGWDAARTPWNLAIRQEPAAVAMPLDADDVRHVVAAARASGLSVTVQPRGHGANGSLDGCILVRTTAFDEITVDAAGKVARVGSGVSWGALLPRLEGTGLIALAGTSPDVTVAGFLLSGGHSWFSRLHGLAAHSIRAVELVDAQGEFRRVTADSDPELLWALRGAGGLFGIVTALEIDLFDAPRLFGGKIVFPGAVAETVFRRVAAIMTDAPAELSMVCGVINLPDLEFVPEPLRGQTVATVDVVFVGTAHAAAPLLAPLLASAVVLANQTGPLTIGHLGEVTAEPAEPAPSLDWATAIAAFPVGDNHGLSALVQAFRAASPDGLTMLQLRPLGGALAYPTLDSGGVAGHLAAGYLAFAGAFLLGPRPVDADAVFGPIERALDGGRIGPTIPSFLTAGQDLSLCYPAETLQRLADIKRRVDPLGLLRSNRPLDAAHDPGQRAARPRQTEGTDDVS